MIKKIIILMVLIFSMVFSVSAELLDYDTFNRADGSSLGVTEGQGNLYSESVTNSLNYASILDNNFLLNISNESFYGEIYVPFNSATISEYTIYLKVKSTIDTYFVGVAPYNSDVSTFSSDIFGADSGVYYFYSTYSSIPSNEWLEIVYYKNVLTDYSNLTITNKDEFYNRTFKESQTSYDSLSIFFDGALGENTVLYMDEWSVCSGYDPDCRPVTNTAPVISSISPNTRIELRITEPTQLYTADVTDLEGDANYTWEVGGVEVSTEETYTADWNDIEAGIYTLRLTVDDGEYSDTTTQTLEIRARGGSASSSTYSGTEDDDLITETTKQDDSETTKITPKQQNIFEKFWNWFKNLFSRG